MKFSWRVKLVIVLSVLIIALTALFYLKPWAGVTARANSTHIDIGTVDADGPGYTFADNTVTITRNGYYIITGATNMRCVVVQSGLVDVNITLSSVDINLSNRVGCAFAIMAAEVNLTLVGDSTLISGYHAGLLVSSGATLVITESSKGSLRVTGGSGAGIGGGGDSRSGTAGNITIMGGIVRATGSEGRAGIGGGAGGAGGNITIGGSADVTAVGGNSNYSDGGAGIGGGAPGGTSGNITITGNADVTAVGGIGGTLLRAGGSSGGGAGVGSGGGRSTANSIENIIINNTGRRDFQGGTGGSGGNGADVETGGSS